MISVLVKIVVWSWKWAAVAKLLLRWRKSRGSVCVCVRECLLSLTVRVRVSHGAMIKVEERNIKSVVENECGGITHSAWPAVFLMTSLSCGFHENQTSSRSCFHTKPSCFGDLNAFSLFFTTTKLIVWMLLQACFFSLFIFITCESLSITQTVADVTSPFVLGKIKCPQCKQIYLFSPCNTHYSHIFW